MSDILICSRCGSGSIRPAALRTSQFLQTSFVCENCRCKDCKIVLQVECNCGDRHAEPSPTDLSICVECQRIRDRVALLEHGMLQTRKTEIESEEPIYGVPIKMCYNGDPYSKLDNVQIERQQIQEKT